MGVVITEQNQLVLETLARYYVLTRQMIQTMCFPHVRGSRSVCERLRKLKKAGFISQAQMQVVLSGQNASPVYFPNKKTAETLAAIHDDDSYLNVYTNPPSTRLLFHWIEIAKMHHIVDQAVEACDAIEVSKWLNEWETINKDVPNKALHFSLYSVLQQEPPLTCGPDAGFLVQCNGYRKVFYVEVDRGTDSIRRIARKKPPGYAAMEMQRRHLKHFPHSTVNNFSVLFITTTEHRRDELTRRLREKERPELWKITTAKAATSESFFREPIWHSVHKEPHSLISS